MYYKIGFDNPAYISVDSAQVISEDGAKYTYSIVSEDKAEFWLVPIDAKIGWDQYMELDKFYTMNLFNKKRKYELSSFKIKPSKVKVNKY